MLLISNPHTRVDTTNGRDGDADRIISFQRRRFHGRSHTPKTARLCRLIDHVTGGATGFCIDWLLMTLKRRNIITAVITNNDARRNNIYQAARKRPPALVCAFAFTAPPRKLVTAVAMSYGVVGLYSHSTMTTLTYLLLYSNDVYAASPAFTVTTVAVI